MDPQDIAQENQIKGQLTDGERTLHTIQLGDVVSHLGTDYMVEGMMTLDEDGPA